MSRTSKKIIESPTVKDWVVIHRTLIQVFGPFTKEEALQYIQEKNTTDLVNRKILKPRGPWYARRGEGNIFRVWEEGWPWDVWEEHTAEQAIATYGTRIRYLFDNEDNNSDWDGETFLTTETE